MKVPAYVLAGGESRRFGSDKARARVGGATLLEHAAASVARVASSVSVVASRPDVYADLGFRTIGDLDPGHGPLGGLLTALRDAASGGTAGEWVLVTACDWVGLRPEWIETFVAAVPRVPPGTRAIAYRDTHWQPLPALYHLALAPEAARRLIRGELALVAMLEAARAHAIPPPPTWHRARQMNTPD